MHPNLAGRQQRKHRAEHPQHKVPARIFTNAEQHVVLSPAEYYSPTLGPRELATLHNKLGQDMDLVDSIETRT